MRLIAFLLSLLFSLSAGATACDGTVSCPFLVQPASTQATILLNASWDATGIGGGHTTYCCATVIQPATLTNATIALHGGGGDEFDFGRQLQVTTLSTLTYTVTGASWASTYGGISTLNTSSDPSAAVTVGNVINVAGVASSGGTGAGYNGNGLTVLGVTSNSIAVSQISGGSPGTFTACGGGGQPACGTITVQTITPSSVVYAYVNYFHVAIALVQGLPPLGGTDNANTALFTGTLSANTLTAGTPTSGIIALSQILSGSGITGTPTITAKGSGVGYAGTYTYSGPTLSVGPVSVSANGCPVSPNAQTWSNWNTTSCRDDSTALDALSQALQTKYSLAAGVISCIGHSEGAGMCMRMLWEHPADFGHFGAISMPFSLYFDAAGGGHTATPATMRPVWWMVGGRDATVCLDVADNIGCGGTANQMHATIAATALTAQSVDSGALTPGNQITSGAADGTYITACSDATHCTVSPSQTVGSSTAMNMNNTYSAQIQNNSANQNASNFAFPLYTIWPNYVNSAATWANAYTLHGCPLGGGSQLTIGSATVAAATTGNLFTWDPCGGYIELNIVGDAGHDTKSITTDLGGYPPFVRFELWAVAH